MAKSITIDSELYRADVGNIIGSWFTQGVAEMVIAMLAGACKGVRRRITSVRDETISLWV